MDLIPRKASFIRGEPIEIDIFGGQGPIAVQLWHLDRQVGTAQLPGGDSSVQFHNLPDGGYGVLARDAAEDAASTAFDLADCFQRPRYGFVADFPAGRQPDGLIDTARRLHLNLIQFYDWAHRYAQLVPDTEAYSDPLGRSLSMTTVRAMTDALRPAGSVPMGYAAVYAVGGTDWPRWEHAGLFAADGQPHVFPDDLLRIIDPANPEWLSHFTADLHAATCRAGFGGFHLDSYGWPKRAFRADGSICDLSDAFAAMLDRLRADLPGTRLLFNNVNDFPTWSTARTGQDGSYIEVWAPHTTLGHLGGLIERARAFRRGQAPILAAYLSVYDRAPVAAADAAARLVMATIFSHGGTHLLNGENDTVLIDPYYPRNHPAGPSTRALMRTWYDFLVRYGDLLLDPDAVDVTRSYTGGINEELVFDTPEGIRVATDPEPGAVWARVVRVSRGLIVHLIDLRDQADITWDAPKQPVTGTSGLRLRILRTLATSRPLVTDPDNAPGLTPLPVTADGRYDSVTLPSTGAWTMIVLPDRQTWHAP